jgi:hypothetical protein
VHREEAVSWSADLRIGAKVPVSQRADPEIGAPEPIL